MAVGCVVWWLAAFGCWRRRTVGVVAMVAQRRNGGVLGVNSILSVHFFALPSKAHQPVSGLAHVAFVQHSDVVQVRESTKFTARARPSRLIDKFASPELIIHLAGRLGSTSPPPRFPDLASPTKVHQLAFGPTSASHQSSLPGAFQLSSFDRSVFPFGGWVCC